MRPLIASLMAAFLSACATPSPAPPSELTLRAAEIVGARTLSLAERVLGAERAIDVESFSVGQSPLGGIAAISFFHRPTPARAEFCRRIVDLVWLRAAVPAGYPDGRDGLYRIGDIRPMLQIAMSPACDRAGDLSFATVQPRVSQEAAIAMLQRFAAAVRAARNEQPLPFELTCRDTLPMNECGDGGRRALAGLEIGEVQLIEGRSIVVGAPNHAPWQIQLMAFDSPYAGVTMVREVPAPF